MSDIGVDARMNRIRKQLESINQLMQALKIEGAELDLQEDFPEDDVSDNTVSPKLTVSEGKVIQFKRKNV